MKKIFAVTFALIIMMMCASCGNNPVEPIELVEPEVIDADELDGAEDFESSIDESFIEAWPECDWIITGNVTESKEFGTELGKPGMYYTTGFAMTIEKKGGKTPEGDYIGTISTSTEVDLSEAAGNELKNVDGYDFSGFLGMDIGGSMQAELEEVRIPVFNADEDSYFLIAPGLPRIPYQQGYYYAERDFVLEYTGTTGFLGSVAGSPFYGASDNASSNSALIVMILFDSPTYNTEDIYSDTEHEVKIIIAERPDGSEYYLRELTGTLFRSPQ